MIESFTNAGKAVFCEKPVDLSLARVKACLKVVEAIKGCVMVGFNRRFAPNFMAVKAAIDAGTVGEVESVFASTSVLTDPAIAKLGDFDSTNIILRTATGKQAIITNTRRAT